ncbi:MULTISPECIES: UbiA family prenyltransferase [unclassified Archaeoglobus]|jgi:geranylgeranylglycerol-phosphate geranylgeranyltransferase|uniref:UbiA family prenyltransferase n=1 Tax=unclassified Archaeoglobus TaxID=2643606 RepID=UPI0025BAD988|nr:MULTISPECIES: UbiA family prenyltransferase [unclassified Archaeoglobus]
MPTSKQFLKALWELFRLEHGLMYGFGVVIGVYVSNPHFTDFSKVLFGYLTAVFLQASAFALNDYSDYEVDVANNRLDRPLVRGDLSRDAALKSGLLMMPLGFTAAGLISPLALLFAVVVTIIGYSYNIKLKEYGFAGNVYIAFTMAAPFLFGSIVVSDRITESAVLLSSMAFLSGLGREVMKGIEDVEGDALRNVRSIARVMGLRVAALISALLYAAAVLISPLPLLVLEEYMTDIKYAIPVVITDVMLLYVAVMVVRKYEKELIPKYRKLTLIAMSFGLIGFLAGAF